MYQALYRKFRPTVFDDLVGQPHITSTLKNQIILNTVGHAYLFCGTRGTGKTSAAKIFARSINCLNPLNGSPCNECASCAEILNGSSMDVIEMDAASNNKVEDVRNIRDEVLYPPTTLKYKVYIIDEAHMLTTSAFNALLKTLEEPPKYVVFIFATTEPHKLPATILSRCQRFDFKRVAPPDIEKRVLDIMLSEQKTIDDAALKLLTRLSDGSVRNALSILEQCTSTGIDHISYQNISDSAGIVDPETLLEIYDSILSENLSQTFFLIDKAQQEGFDMVKVLEDLTGALRNIMVAKTVDEPFDLIDAPRDFVLKLKKLASKVALYTLISHISILYESLNLSKRMNEPRLILEYTAMKLSHKPASGSLEDLRLKISELEDQIKSGNMRPAPIKTEIAVEEKEPVSTPELDFSENDLANVDILNEEIEELFKMDDVEEEPIIEPAELPLEVEDTFDVVDLAELDAINDKEENEQLLEQLENEEVDVIDEEPSEDIMIEGQEGFLIAEEPMKPEENNDTPTDEVNLSEFDFEKIIDVVGLNDGFGLKSILKKGTFEYQDNVLYLEFENEAMYELCVRNDGAKKIKEGILELYQKQVKVKLKMKETTQEKEEDPLTTLMELQKSLPEIITINEEEL